MSDLWLFRSEQLGNKKAVSIYNLSWIWVCLYSQSPTQTKKMTVVSGSQAQSLLKIKTLDLLFNYYIFTWFNINNSLNSITQLWKKVHFHYCLLKWTFNNYKCASLLRLHLFEGMFCKNHIFLKKMAKFLAVIHTAFILDRIIISFWMENKRKYTDHPSEMIQE